MKGKSAQKSYLDTYKSKSLVIKIGENLPYMVKCMAAEAERYGTEAELYFLTKCYVTLLLAFFIAVWSLFRPRLHGNGSLWNRTRTVRIGLAFTRELLEPFHTELLAVKELVHQESRSGKEPNQKFLV